MIKLTADDYNNLSEIVLLSNTPGFLYNSIKNSKISLRLSDNFSEKEILACLRSLVRKKSKLTYKEALTIYALAIAVESKGPNSVSNLLKIEMSWLQWWDDLLKIIQSKVRSANYHSITLQTPVEIKKKHTHVSSSSSITTYKINK
jgi:hypothetical protein